MGGKVALSRVTIDCPPEKVWSQLTDLEHWENVTSGRSVAKGPVGPLQKGDFFTYYSRYAPGPIDGCIADADKAQTLSWGDRVLKGLIVGEHRWLLKKQGARRFPLPFRGSAGKTQVTLGHEVTGPLSFIINGDSLEKHGAQWLADLKAACEK